MKLVLSPKSNWAATNGIHKNRRAPLQARGLISISAAFLCALLLNVAARTCNAQAVGTQPTDQPHPNRQQQPSPARAEVDVILWFDTEDYLLPADDDACKRLAGLLSQRGIRATFKVVGEKARVLERRGRQDVIRALKRHDIAYHANFHSVHPTPSEYLAECGLLDGMAEFIRREGGGAADVRRVFSVPTLACYGQPGSSWAPQAIAALKSIGVSPHGTPCYVDEGEHVGLNEQPFWYAGALNVYHMGQNCTRMDLHDPNALEPAERKVTAIADRLREQGGGLISIYYHPCEWVHQEFWDGVNFRRGANPPREQWRPPPQRPAAETEAAFDRFSQYIDYIRAIPGLRFITASQLPGLYPDVVRSEGAPEADVAELARRLAKENGRGIDFQVIGSRAYSLADQFELLSRAAGKLLSGQPPAFPLVASGLLGPDSPPPVSEKDHLDWFAFRDAARDVFDFIQTQQRVPARVFIGADPVAPADFLIALADLYDFHNRTGRLPVQEGVRLGRNLEVLPARHIAKDSPEVFGGWVIHKEGFRAPKILEMGRLQAWTLKPAIRSHF
ncbi:MAG TPA: hypothetical protein VG146_06205 [Verrucomicrobiae bacterium]|nr:hypothetical protein [Verrucomicrobiae bacterium]